MPIDHRFIFSPKFNFAHDNLLVRNYDNGEAHPTPPTVGDFLLLLDEPFLLLDNTHFELLGENPPTPTGDFLLLDGTDFVLLNGEKFIYL